MTNHGKTYEDGLRGALEIVDKQDQRFSTGDWWIRLAIVRNDIRALLLATPSPTTNRKDGDPHDRFDARVGLANLTATAGSASAGSAEPIDWEYRAAVGYQIIGNLANYCGLFEHTEIIKALDYMCGYENAPDPLPWPSVKLPDPAKGAGRVTDEIVEKVARAICIAAGARPDVVTSKCEWPQRFAWQRFEPGARAAIAALEAAIGAPAGGGER